MPVPWKSSLSPYQSSAADPNLQTLNSSEDVAHADPVLGPQFVAHISSSSWFACSNALSLLRKAEAEKDKQYLPDSQLKERKKPRQKEPNVNNMVEKSPPALQEYISCRKCMRKKNTETRWKGHWETGKSIRMKDLCSLAGRTCSALDTACYITRPAAKKCPPQSQQGLKVPGRVCVKTCFFGCQRPSRAFYSASEPST